MIFSQCAQCRKFGVTSYFVLLVMGGDQYMDESCIQIINFNFDSLSNIRHIIIVFCQLH